MHFLFYGFFFAVFIMPVFTCTVIFEKHGQKCQRGADQKCGYNCKCNKSLICECTKPQNAGELQYCYDTIPRLVHSVTTCFKHFRRPVLFCEFYCPEGNLYGVRKNFYVGADSCSKEGIPWSSNFNEECYRNDCNDKININNGVVNCTESDENTKICDISCKDNLTLVGNKEMTCRIPSGPESGWTGMKPMCLNSACLDIMVKNITIENAERPNCIVRQRDNTVICHITCKKGYYLEGKHPIYCFHQKKKELPICFKDRKKCPHLKEGEKFPNRRIVECTIDKEGFQDKCKYECTGFYQVRGKVSGKTKWASCKFSVGEWQFKECIYQPYMCKSLKVTGVKAKCSLGVRAIKNKTWTCNLECSKGFMEKINICNQYPHNISFRCIGQQTFKELTCNHGNIWSGNPIKCLKNFGCEIINDAHTSYSCTEKKYNKNYECTISCDEGYHVHGAATMKCFRNSTWNKKTLCKKNYDCRIPYGVIERCPPGQDYDNSPWKCHFICPHNKHYYGGHKGSNYCKIDGNWAYTPLICVY